MAGGPKHKAKGTGGERGMEGGREGGEGEKRGVRPAPATRRLFLVDCGCSSGAQVSFTQQPDSELQCGTLRTATITHGSPGGLPLPGMHGRGRGGGPPASSQVGRANSWQHQHPAPGEAVPGQQRCAGPAHDQEPSRRGTSPLCSAERPWGATPSRL